MVRFLLSIKAELENVANLVPASDDFEYFFRVKCNNCNEIHPKFVSLNRIDRYDLSGSRGSANFVWRCGMYAGKRESSAEFDSNSPKPYSDENAQFAPLLTVECRGLEFVEFDPQGTWRCVGTTGNLFSEVDLSEREWTDYDERAALPVGISGFESRWTRA